MDTLLGTKRGMTQIWTEAGDRIPVTVLDVAPNLVTALKTTERDGYEAVQLGFGTIRAKLLRKPQLGAFEKAQVEPEPPQEGEAAPASDEAAGEQAAPPSGEQAKTKAKGKQTGLALRRHLREVRGPVEGRRVGEELTCSIFEAGQSVDVIGTSKGKGFQGPIKLHNHSRGPTSHGSDNVRRSGSIGMHQFPGRVLKGKRMAARMGGERVTVKNLTVVSVDPQAHVMLVRGPVPGNNGSLVMVRRSAMQPKPMGKGS